MSMGKKQKQQEPEKSEPQLNNEDLVIEKSKEVVKYQKELDCLLSARKNAGAAAGHKETDSDDSDAAHDDDDDVEDDTVASQYHRDTNAAQQSVASKRFKVDASNVVHGEAEEYPNRGRARGARRKPIKETYCTILSVGCGVVSEEIGSKHQRKWYLTRS
jgi:hypothetical protein